ncbi:leucyl/phenylalanyl-tRNA protein transferase, putative [Bodo saltans]|uniref:Leucyl/phenylalanyl-tRNA protein transferase, putative n=1 Tax=Bodo saltans TaxID=75058 RepID=A0A0S4JCB2_BODSA|nr:leucyl/phenylalanyl-tRNA protein transferase, putative [Bodo saltans]|eukprot:CUG89182.1 leucyl/phenylalanyl-tRNA protein transferase, putative [Bodo saltans]
MKYTKEHFKSHKALGEERFAQLEPLLRQKVADGVTAAQSSSDVRTVAKLTAQELQFVAKDMPLVKQPSDLEKLPETLGKKKEFAFSPLFSPELVDHCCRRGIFPLTLEVKRGVFVFAPKLHTERAVVRLVDEPMAPIPSQSFEDGASPPALFDPRDCQAKSKVANKCVFYINRPEDLSEALQLIHLQHGENWLCAPLRACVVEMLRHPDAYETKMTLFIVRTKPSPRAVDGDDAPASAEGELVAAELGYIVGDIYTSATGAYRASGCGTLQLAVLGVWLASIGVRIWDLGMQLDYKERCLNTVLLPRNKWLQLVAARRALISGDLVQQARILSALQHHGPQSCSIPQGNKDHRGNNVTGAPTSKPNRDSDVAPAAALATAAPPAA